MKIKAKCVSASLRKGVGKEPDVVQFSFLQVDKVDGKAGEYCFDGAIRVHVDSTDKKFQVGNDYTLKLEVAND